jgi:glycosyltransferase involved in cell wall biosynthesis
VRILHIDTGAEMRGGQHQVLLLMKQLREAGHECELLAREHGPLWRAGIGADFSTGTAKGSAVLARSGKFDIVHAHDARAHSLAAVSSRRRFVVSRRVAFPVRKSAASSMKYKRAARYLAVSQFVASELKKAGIPERKIDVVYDAIDSPVLSDAWNPEYPAVALATADPQKGRDLIESSAKTSGVEVLYSDDLMRDLTRASIFVYISRSEGLGSAVLLAMQMGVPVIASSVGGLSEIFSDGESGIYVRNEVADIVKAMRRVLANRPLALKLIESGRKRIAEAFTKEHLLAGTIAAYERALGRH